MCSWRPRSSLFVLPRWQRVWLLLVCVWLCNYRCICVFFFDVSVCVCVCVFFKFKILKWTLPLSIYQKLSQLIAYGSLYRSRVKQHSKLNQRSPPPSTVNILCIFPNRQHFYCCFISLQITGGRGMISRVLLMQNKMELLLLDEVKRDAREGCSQSAAV